MTEPFEDAISSHFFGKFKENMKFLIPIGVGAVLAIILGSKIIGYSLDTFPLPTILFFTGLILGGVPMLYNKVKGNFKISNIIFFLLTFAFIIGIMFLKTGKEVRFENMNFMSYILLFIVGIISAATMIIPGISGSFMLMVMGYYKPILNTINALTSFENIGHNISILLPFGLGILVGFVGIAKLLEILFQKFEIPTYFGIIGFVLASIIGIFASTSGLSFSILPFLIGIILFLIGFGIAYRLGD